MNIEFYKVYCLCDNTHTQIIFLIQRTNNLCTNCMYMKIVKKKFINDNEMNLLLLFVYQNCLIVSNQISVDIILQHLRKLL